MLNFNFRKCVFKNNKYILYFVFLKIDTKSRNNLKGIMLMEHSEDRVIKLLFLNNYRHLAACCIITVFGEKNGKNIFSQNKKNSMCYSTSLFAYVPNFVQIGLAVLRDCVTNI